MKNPTSVVLLVSKIVSILSSIVFAVLSIPFFIIGYATISDDMAAQYTQEELEILAYFQGPVSKIMAFLFLIVVICGIVCACLCGKCRELLRYNLSKQEVKPFAIALLIFAIFGGLLPIIPAILLLAMNEDDYRSY